MTVPLRKGSEIETLRPPRIASGSGVQRISADERPLVVPSERTELAVYLVSELIPHHLTMLANAVEVGTVGLALHHARAIRRTAQLVGLARLAALAASVEADLVRQDLLDSFTWLPRLERAFRLGRRELADASALDPDASARW